MQKSDLDNANPTILSESQLPSRGRKRDVVRNGPESKYNDILFSEQPWLWDLSNSTTAWSSDESSDSDGGELADEPIDEQEIYGKRTHTPSCSFLFRFLLPGRFDDCRRISYATQKKHKTHPITFISHARRNDCMDFVLFMCVANTWQTGFHCV